MPIEIQIGTGDLWFSRNNLLHQPLECAHFDDSTDLRRLQPIAVERGVKNSFFAFVSAAQTWHDREVI